MSSSTPSRTDSQPAPPDPRPIQSAPKSWFDTVYETITGRKAPPLATAETQYSRPFEGPAYRNTGNRSSLERVRREIRSINEGISLMIGDQIPENLDCNLPELVVAEHPPGGIPVERRERRKKCQQKPKKPIGRRMKRHPTDDASEEETKKYVKKMKKPIKILMKRV